MIVSFYFLAILVVFIVVINNFMPVRVHPAGETTGVENLNADSSGSASWSYNNRTITGSVTASSSSGCTGTTYTAQSGTLTFTNGSGSTALLSFDYSLTLSGGSCTVDGTSVTAGGTFNKKLEAGGTVAVAITSPEGEGTTSITISNMELAAEQTVNVIFDVPENGSYTVDGESITLSITKEYNNTDSVVLSATPSSGYKFFGWLNVTDGSYFSTIANTNWSFTSECEVKPIFVSSSTPIFQVGSKLFVDLNDANDYAESNGISKIVLISNGTLPAGNYTISNGKTLLIPFDDAQTVYINAPEVVYESHVNPSAFRTLTMELGAKITISSGATLSVPSKLCATGQNASSWNGTPTGKHGRITMNSGSSIDVESGGILSCFGYISGSGTITAKSGSTIWECFQLRCWRGGTATSGMADNSQKVFPMNQYYVQNIEASLILQSGSVEKVFTAVNMSSQTFTASTTFIGSGGMFTIGSGGSIVKRYDGATDRLIIDVNGDVTISSFSLKITGLPLIGSIDLQTKDYVLPIQNNITININSGTTSLGEKQDIAFLPGSFLNIAQGSTFKISSDTNVFVYDKTQWGNYGAGGAQLVVVGYSTVNGTTAKRTATSLVDAKINVNGTIDVLGGLYTTQDGAEIVSSSGTGKVVFQNKAGTSTKTYQATQSGSSITYVEIPITSAKLKNSDNSYTETKIVTTASSTNSTVFLYDNSSNCKVWHVDNNSKYKILFDANSGAGTMSALTVTCGQALTNNSFTRIGYEFDGWNTKADGSGKSFAEGAIISGSLIVDINNNSKYESSSAPKYSITLYAKWKLITYTITYELNGGTNESNNPTSYTIEDLPLILQDPIKTDYTFEGWFTEASFQNRITQIEVSSIGNKDLYAKWTSGSQTTFIVTWLNYDNNVLEVDEDVLLNSIPTYDGQTPTKPADVQYTYTFSGWSPNISPVVSNITYIAQFEETLNKYTITFVDDDNSIILAGIQYDYGTSANDITIPANPTKSQTDQYTYIFDKWTPTITDVLGDAIYKATYEAIIRKYTVVWRDGNDNIVFTDFQSVEYGTIPSYHGDTPTKDATEVYTYVWNNGWTPTIVAVTGDATYTATFDEVPIKYQVSLEYESEILSNYEYDLVTSHTFPDKDYDGFTGTHTDYTIKKWLNDSGNKNIDYVLTASDSGKTFTAFTGGFYHESSNTYYIEPTRSTFKNGLIKGLYKIKTEDGDNLKIHYFDETSGILHNNNSIYTFNGDSNKYVIEGGFVKSDEGLAKSNNDYYYVTDKNYLIKEGRHYLTEFNGNPNFKEGYYNFSDSFIERNNVNNDANKFGKIYIDNNSLYYDGILLPYGLYQASDNKYYYAMHNGTLLNNNSIYIVSSKANGYTTYQNIVCKFNNKKMYNPFTGSDV